MRRGAASEARKYFFVRPILSIARRSPRDRFGISEILQNRHFEFLKFSQIAIWNFCRNQICKFREIENAKTFCERSRKIAKRNQASPHAGRLDDSRVDGELRASGRV
jgi:hypothetical protein